jgi:arginine decarboxylase
MTYCPKHFKVVSGVGRSRYPLVAFDNALRYAGIGDFNLVKVSSILPAGCSYSEQIPMDNGSILYAAYSTLTVKEGENGVTAVAVVLPSHPNENGVIFECALVENQDGIKDIMYQMCQEAMSNRDKAISETRFVSQTVNGMVRFSASIENVGDKEIKTKTSNLYIDQGIPAQLTNDRDSSDVGAKSFKFPFILEHREYIEGRPDCVLCKKCFRGNDYCYPEEIVDGSFKIDPRLLRTHILLEHLSNKSILYILPGEKFSEDVVVQFKSAGVYRVTLFVGTEGEADCSCATKQFYISKSLS